MLTTRLKSKLKFKKLLGKFPTLIFCGLIGLAASLILFLILYRVLLIDSSITSFVVNTSRVPFYFWPYTILTIGAIILFGINASLFVYRLRKYGPPRLKSQSGTGVGSLVGIAASACPVCGSTILSAIGIAGGLAAFPFQGLELKTLAFGLMAIPVWLTAKDLKKKGCVGDVCPTPRNASFSKKDIIWLAIAILVIILSTTIAWDMLKSEPIIQNVFTKTANPALAASQTESKYEALQQQVRGKVFPKEGIKIRIFTGNSIPLMVSLGIIDLEKLQKQYQNRGNIPPEIMDLLTKPTTKPLTITADNQFWLVTLLWPLGLANKLEMNRESPVSGKNLFNFASTGGWSLGKEKNGGTYFNKYNLIPLTPNQEQKAKTIAESIYRPCCNNPTFFQDCNHGSAALALIELGVSQGLTDEEIYRDVLTFNALWFPQNYLETALYFKEVKQQSWESIDPKLILSKDYSSASGWAQNVHAEVSKIPGLVPKPQRGGSCGT